MSYEIIYSRIFQKFFQPLSILGKFNSFTKQLVKWKCWSWHWTSFAQMRMAGIDCFIKLITCLKTHLSSPLVIVSNALLNQDRLKFIRPRPTDSTGYIINAENYSASFLNLISSHNSPKNIKIKNRIPYQTRFETECIKSLHLNRRFWHLYPLIRSKQGLKTFSVFSVNLSIILLFCRRYIFELKVNIRWMLENYTFWLHQCWWRKVLAVTLTSWWRFWPFWSPISTFLQ